MAPMSGMTSQPNLNRVVEALRVHAARHRAWTSSTCKRSPDYWEAVREFYVPFETGMMASTADVYTHEMPGGQYTNLYQQAQSLGLADRWPEICRMYADVNQLFGDIVKVTPSSKAVGDMALFLVTNNLTVADVLDPKRELAFPESVVDLLAGRMGQPPGGFPPAVQKRILRDQKPLTGRPGASLPPADFKAVAAELEKRLGRPPKRQDILSYLVYPKVFSEYITHHETYSDISVIPTPTSFSTARSRARKWRSRSNAARR